MKIGFFCEWGEIPEIGTGHFYRSKWTSEAMKHRGHDTIDIAPGNDLPIDLDVLVIDDLRSQRSLIGMAKYNNTKVVLIDGIEEDVPEVNLAISAKFNIASQYKGIEYMSFLPRGDRSYKSLESTKVFVSMGGFDANNIASTVLEVLQEMGIDAIVTRSINHEDLSSENTEVFVGDDYYIPMEKCKIGVVNGGLTMFQALHFGLPSLVIPQYKHQLEYVQLVKSEVLLAYHNKESIHEGIERLLGSKELRGQLSTRSQNLVDGKAICRTCNLIEGLV